ncbi:MAG: hypothetical protein HYT90_02780 [Candidatus Omnitrophica bacterium]|nr:hypothetical protein [Candidatus Omnitrophota bacterium]
MNKTLPLVVVVGLVGVGTGFLLRGSQPRGGAAPTEQAKSQLIQASMTPAAGEKIIHTFPTQEALQAFVNFWQQRQERLLRMGMLEGYWNNDQGTLNQLNSQLTTQYQLDLAKRHVLDTEKRVLLEHETPAAEPAAAEPETQPASEEADEGKVIHTFADEDAMKAFAELWQQRQSVIVRMAVLKAYWDSENSLVAQLNKQLADDYQVDVAKLYALDEQRRVLIERPAPAAPEPAAEAQPAAEPQPAASAPDQPVEAEPTPSSTPSPVGATPSQTGQ